ncbi:MAG: ferrous iron transport protein B [Anaerolineae bacterium]|nr:ferrous iron transport protein B [Anaerolineae bacterium]
MIRSSLTIALAGNPNVGKSTIFNALTGAQQHVGNWPGKTVEKREGKTRIQDREIAVVDLPGTYSLAAQSAEEIITRDFIMHEASSVVVVVVDASNLERNLYFVTQILELEVPAILVLNMSDAARSRGIQIDRQLLSQMLGGIPVIETVGSRQTGIDQLKQTILDVIDCSHPQQIIRVDYGEVLENAIAALQTAVSAEPAIGHTYPARWVAIKLLENDEDMCSKLETANYQSLLHATQQTIEQLGADFSDDIETLIADRRYRFVGRVVEQAVVRANTGLETRSDKLDRIVAHRVWGVLIFLLLMWLVFQFTANVSAPFVDWIDGVLSGPITHWTAAIVDAVGLEETWVEALLIDGVLAGVGGVLVFVPVLLFLFFTIAILEDSGYMARAALVMDGVMHAIGLPGKSFLPMIVGFGCTVPAIYATRTIEDEDDRRLTGFLLPFMSCGARLPVYTVFAAAFFGANAGNLIFGMYLLGIAVALTTGFVLKHTVYREKLTLPLVLELPPYRVPTTLRNVWRQVWNRTQDFIHNAATIILMSSIVIWLLLALPARTNRGSFNAVQAGDSVFGSISETIAPALAPAGFGSWKTAGSLLTGLIAKEAIIGTMNQIYVQDTGPAPETEPSFRDDVVTIFESLGETGILIVQETVNIMPRTLNMLPGVSIAEARFVDDGEADNTTALEQSLTSAFIQTAGSTAKGKLAALAFNVFVLLYIPCMASVAAMRHEFGTRWMLYQVVYTVFLAWLVSLFVYQGGLLLGLG